MHVIINLKLSGQFCFHARPVTKAYQWLLSAWCAWRVYVFVHLPYPIKLKTKLALS